jgi:hypothetical protein
LASDCTTRVIITTEASLGATTLSKVAANVGPIAGDTTTKISTFGSESVEQHASFPPPVSDQLQDKFFSGHNTHKPATLPMILVLTHCFWGVNVVCCIQFYICTILARILLLAIF